jgi:hypothetical protein
VWKKVKIMLNKVIHEWGEIKGRGRGGNGIGRKR